VSLDLLGSSAPPELGESGAQCECVAVVVEVKVVVMKVAICTCSVLLSVVFLGVLMIVMSKFTSAV
jgi:hypothetical protein